MIPCPYCGRPDSFEPAPGWFAKDVAAASDRLRAWNGDKPATATYAAGYRAGVEAARSTLLKPLDWRDTTIPGRPETLHLRAWHPFGHYTITCEDFAEWPYVLRPFVEAGSNFQTVEDAKAAAEADFRRKATAILALPEAPASVDVGEVLSEPAAEHKADGWTLNVDHLKLVQKIAHASFGWYVECLEQVEAVILAHQQCTPPAPAAVDVAEMMAEDCFVSPDPLPTAYEAELLTILIEECAEIALELAQVQQRATKMLRFGTEEVQPGQPLTNAQRLSEEVGDLLTMIDCAEKSGLVDSASIEVGRQRKRVKLAKYMQTGTYRTGGRTGLSEGEGER